MATTVGATFGNYLRTVERDFGDAAKAILSSGSLRYAAILRFGTPTKGIVTIPADTADQLFLSTPQGWTEAASETS
jgi:hypothetical protein